MPSKRKRPKAAAPKRGRGQPEKEIDLKQLTILCQMQATTSEIAAYFDCSPKTIERHRNKPEFREAMDNGRLKGLVSLRRAMFQSALGGNVTSQIWLSKNHLGMRDKFPEEIEDQRPITKVQYEWVAPEPEASDEAEDPKAASEKNAKTGAIIQ